MGFFSVCPPVIDTKHMQQENIKSRQKILVEGDKLYKLINIQKFFKSCQEKQCFYYYIVALEISEENLHEGTLFKRYFYIFC